MKVEELGLTSVTLSGLFTGQLYHPCGRRLHEDASPEMFTYPVFTSSLPVSHNHQPRSTGSLHVGVPDFQLLRIAEAKQPGTSLTRFLRPIQAHLQG